MWSVLPHQLLSNFLLVFYNLGFLCIIEHRLASSAWAGSELSDNSQNGSERLLAVRSMKGTDICHGTRYFRWQFGCHVMCVYLNIRDTTTPWWDVDGVIIPGSLTCCGCVLLLDSKVGTKKPILLERFLLSGCCRLEFARVDFDVHVLFRTVTICLLTDAILPKIDFVDGFRRWIVDLGLLCGFGDIHALLINEVN